MSDYEVTASLTRNALVDVLLSEDMQLVYVLTGTVLHDISRAINHGELHEDVSSVEDTAQVVANLRVLADAIEKGFIA